MSEAKTWPQICWMIPAFEGMRDHDEAALRDRAMELLVRKFHYMVTNEAGRFVMMLDRDWGDEEPELICSSKSYDECVRLAVERVMVEK